MTGHEGHTGNQHQDNDSSASAMMSMELPEAFQNDFRAVLPLYLQMKDAFVASDASAIASEAGGLLKEMNSLDVSSLGVMEKAHYDRTVELLEKINGSMALKDQRAYFVDLNQQLVALASNVDLDGRLYVQLCPMANNNRGAIWLSADEEIRNPYYGNEMLTCGKVEQVLN